MVLQGRDRIGTDRPIDPMSMPHPTPVRYAIYTRQSTDKGDEFSSCEVQFLTCRESAEALGRPIQ